MNCIDRTPPILQLKIAGLAQIENIAKMPISGIKNAYGGVVQDSRSH